MRHGDNRRESHFSETTPKSTTSFAVFRHAARAQPSISHTARSTNYSLSYDGLSVETIGTACRMYLHKALDGPTLSFRDRHKEA